MLFKTIQYAYYIFMLCISNLQTQTYLGEVEQLITEDNNYQWVGRENCGGVIMMKPEMT